MTLTVLFPAALVLLALLPLFWLFAWATWAVNVARLGRARYLTLVLLRTLIFAGLILAFAGAQITRAVDDTAVVFLIDGSDSLSPALREQAIDYVNSALTAADPDDQAAVVVFGAAAAVERAMTPPAPLGRLTSVVSTSRTNVAEAIQLGLALLPGDIQKRMVLLSDGGENSGRAAEAARIAALRGIPLDVVPLAGERGADALLSGIDVPATAREGQELPVSLLIESTVAGTARLELFADGELVAEQDVELDIGNTRFTVNVPAGESGFRRLEARITAPFDTQPLNNRAAAFTEVQGPPRVLLLATQPDRAAPLQAALEATGLRSEILGPAQLPTDPVQLQRYAAVALVDIPSRSLGLPAQRALVTYVQEQGGGLLMIGGTESFGAGGWRRSPIAEILPVDLDPPNPDQRPDLGLALVIDRSGSMSDSVSGTRNRLDLAKEAVYQAALGLAESDQLGVFVFDEFAETILPMQPLPGIVALEEALSRVSLGGGTNIRSGVALATETIATVDARIRHVILLTDGLAESNYADLIAQMRADGITISVVSIGAGANPNLRTIAQNGGGAFYSVTSVAEVPQIFLEETVRVARRDIVELDFTPVRALDAPPVRGLDTLPNLRGYNTTGFRDTARTLLTAPDPELPGERVPLLAIQQVGLGRTLAWTSDLKAQWANDWIGWERFPPFATGLVDAVLPPLATDQLTLEARADAAQASFELSVTGLDGLPVDLSAINGRLLDPAGEATDLRFNPVGLGRYRAVAATDQPGIYLAQIAAVDAAGEPLGVASAGLVVSYSPEYGQRSANPGLLTDLAGLTAGQVAPPADTIFVAPGQQVGQVREIAIPLLWLALILLPCDIALRRLFLRNIAVRLPRLGTRPATALPEPDPALARLQAARERARRPTTTATQTTHDLPQADVQARRDAPRPETPIAQPVPMPLDEDRLATLLARKRRRDGEG